jgi:hypothetical protein
MSAPRPSAFELATTFLIPAEAACSASQSKVPSRRDVPIKRRACDPKLLAQGSDVSLRLAHGGLCKTKLSRSHLRPPTSLAATSPSRSKSCPCAFTDQLALELRPRAKMDELPRWCIDSRPVAGKQPQSYSVCREVVDRVFTRWRRLRQSRSRFQTTSRQAGRRSV